ncbi:hypothetical protein CYY_001235 [Polysphondylium violaceum]|uniref:Uncharacterized protein n=1 Tax=Polysphondylium violaceum TaxID=133409 RepID=A0A8J4V847_9MYCE|nr:hypothetical protein CYY_001235 [Polysphondylium violaceum]
METDNLYDDDVTKGVARTSIFVAASRAIITQKYLNLINSDTLNKDPTLHGGPSNNNTGSAYNSNNNNQYNSNINNKIKEIEIQHAREIITKGIFQPHLISHNDISFIRDQICIYDPFAVFFLDSVDSKKLLIDSFSKFYSSSTDNDIKDKECQMFSEFVEKSHPLNSWLEFLSKRSISRIGFRTKYIDQVLMDSLSVRGSVPTSFFYTQVVFCGAGLDSRALRLPIPAHVSVFEIDLPSVMDYKKKVLETAQKYIQPVSSCRLEHIAGNLVQDDRWISSLLDSGFNSAMHTLWIMEGLLMYLNENEISNLMNSISLLSAPNSKLLIHTVSPSLKESMSMSSNSDISPFIKFPQEEFVSYHSNPVELLEQYGFSKDTTCVSYVDLNSQFECNDPQFQKSSFSKFSTGIFTG